jgi:hypothetical protein
MFIVFFQYVVHRPLEYLELRLAQHQGVAVTAQIPVASEPQGAPPSNDQVPEVVHAEPDFYFLQKSGEVAPRQPEHEAHVDGVTDAHEPPVCALAHLPHGPKAAK